MGTYKKIDISDLPAELSEEAAKGIIDWRIASKKGISQRIFNNAISVGIQCVTMKYYPNIDDVFLRWEESGWTGIKYVLKEAEREAAQNFSLRDSPIQARLHDTSWAPRSTRDIGIEEELNDRSWAVGVTQQ